MAERSATLKKLLKKWERTFQVKNGRKPRKEDLQNGPSEVQDLYKEYCRAKKASTKCQEAIVTLGEREGKEQERPQEREDGVFGADLNKKSEVKSLNGASVRSRTWKLPPLQTGTAISQSCSVRDRPKSTVREPPAAMNTSRREGDSSHSVPSSTHEDLPNSSDIDSLTVANQLGGFKKLKYGGVSLSMLEKCDLDPTVAEKDGKRAAQIRKCTGDSTLNEDSLLARILGQDEDDSRRDHISSGADISTQGRTSECCILDECKVNDRGSSPSNSFHHDLSHLHSSNLPPSSRLELPVMEKSSSDEPVCVDRGVKMSPANDIMPGSSEMPELSDDTRLVARHTVLITAQEGLDSEDEHSMTPQKVASSLCDDGGGSPVTNGVGGDRNGVSASDVSEDEEDEYNGNVKNCSASTTNHGGGISKSSGGVAVSENFRKLNMKVKRYTRRPGRGMTGERYKRQEWKKRQKEVGGGSSGHGKGGGRFVCFKCGKTGHWAKNCTNKGGFTSLGSFDGEEVEYSELNEEEKMDLAALEELEKESPFPTIREALQMATGEKVERRMTTEEEVATTEMDDDLLHDTQPPPPEVDSQFLVHPFGSDGQCPPPVVEPLLKWEPRSSESTPSIVTEALQSLGFSSFRPGQKEVVMRILSGQSTLMITATGSGKSLCYQLPSYLYRQQGRGPCITLVVSPLVSLMDDQVLRLPPGLKGACLHTNKTRLQRDKVFQDLAKGKVDILFLSPEALVGGVLWSRRGGGGWSLKDIPPIVFACIDEVHCISEWSHNFRPSYLRLHKTLRSRLGVRCLLGLTATATHTTGLAVAQQLGVAEEDVVWGAAVPSNLCISVSRDEDRDLALVELLSREPYQSLDSIIIYCTRQQTTEGVARMLRTSLQSWNQNENEKPPHVQSECPIESLDSGYTGGADKTTKKRKAALSRGKGKRRKRSGAAIVAECYHAGMSASQRRSVQNKFMRGDLRIVVATIAFGMGLDKSDVRAIIHYNMPQSMESYVQEVGRAGRDGNPAYCHTFIDQEGKDLSEMRRNIYANSIDPYTLKKFVEKIFQDSEKECTEREVAVDIESTVEALDVSRECLETLLCYLELAGKVRLLGTMKDMCTLKFYGGRQQFKLLSWKVPAVAAAAACLKYKGEDLDAAKQITFSITEVAHSMGQDSTVVRSELLGLQVNDRGTSYIPTGGRSSVLVELDGLAFHLVSPSNLTCEEKEEAIQFLQNKIRDHEKLALEKLHLLHAVLRHASKETQDRCVTQNLQDQSLKNHIQKYFSSDSLTTSDLIQDGIPVTSNTCDISAEEEEQIGRDVGTLVARFSSQQFGGRSIARIFHGISSPCFPAIVWGAQRGFWRRYLHIDFHSLSRITTKKLVLIQTSRT